MADIFDTVRNMHAFTTLISAIQAAGLSETFKGPGPFTLFAPVNDAFAALHASTVDALFKDPQSLREILSYHTTSEQFMPVDLFDRRFLKTLHGQRLAVEISLTAADVDELGEPDNTVVEAAPHVEDSNHLTIDLPGDPLLVADRGAESSDGIPDDVVLTNEAVVATAVLENVTVNGAHIVQWLQADNGMLYAINAVLMPRARPWPR